MTRGDLYALRGEDGLPALRAVGGPIVGDGDGICRFVVSEMVLGRSNSLLDVVPFGRGEAFRGLAGLDGLGLPGGAFRGGCGGRGLGGLDGQNEQDAQGQQ